MILGAFLSRYIEPGESLAEVTYGLIMCLTFTLSSGVAAQYNGTSTIHLIYAAIGCNLAWGMIDAIMFVMGRAFERSRIARIHRLIRVAPDRLAAIERLENLIQDHFGAYSRPADLRQMAEGIYEMAKIRPVPRTHIMRDDLIGASLVFLLVAATVLPVVLPFLVLENSLMTLRISNCLIIVALYCTGHIWARYTNGRPVMVGAMLAALGILMVGIAIVLGG